MTHAEEEAAHCEMEGVPEDAVVDTGVELRADGEQTPLAAGQQQPFQIESLLQSSPQAAPYIDWFVQQRGYVAEVFRREQEVVQRQLAEMLQQQLDFVQQQGHLMRDILAALVSAEQNLQTHDVDQTGHVENNKGSEVSFGVSGQVQRVSDSHLTTSLTETTLTTGWPLVSPSTLGSGMAADAPKTDSNKLLSVDSVPVASRTPKFQGTEPVLAGREWNVNKLDLNPSDKYENLPLLPGAMDSQGTSQQLTRSTLAGPQCTSGCLDDVKGFCILRDVFAEQNDQAGRETNIQALNADLTAFGSTPNEHVVGGAPPSEVRFERIRTKLEFEPPPSPSSSLAQANEPSDRKDSRSWMYEQLELVCVIRSNQRHWEPGAVSECLVCWSEWDPGPDAAVMLAMLKAFALAIWNLTNTKKSSGKQRRCSRRFCSGRGVWISIDDECPGMPSASTSGWLSISLIYIYVTAAVHIDRKWTCTIGTGAMLVFQEKITAVVRPGPSILKRGDVVTTGIANAPTVRSPLDSSSARVADPRLSLTV